MTLFVWVDGLTKNSPNKIGRVLEMNPVSSITSRTTASSKVSLPSGFPAGTSKNLNFAPWRYCLTKTISRFFVMTTAFTQSLYSAT